MKKKQIFINAIMSVLQVVLLGAILFILYRFLYRTIGVEQVGIWSVVFATTSMASVANLGLSASVVKFVAKYLARGEEGAVVRVIETSVVSIGVLFGLALWIVYPFLSWVLGFIVPVSSVVQAIGILPYALFSLWITVMASVFQAGLDGCQRIDFRSMVVVVSGCVYLAACLFLVPTYKLMGLAYAQVFQSCVLLIGSWLILKVQVRLLPLFPYRWDKKMFLEMARYGINFQVISICQMLYDPITKVLLTRFGGLGMTGFYEMASRMVVQVRALIVTANQVLVPAIADLYEKEPTAVRKIYEISCRLNLYIAVPIFSLIFILTPVASQILTGHYEATFVLFSILLGGGWFMNTLTVPAYFVVLGTGELQWNAWGHVLIAVLNLGLGMLLGFFYGGIGVVVAWVIALILGSLVNPLMYHNKYKISFVPLLLKAGFGMRFLWMICLSAALILFYEQRDILSPLAMSVYLALTLCFSVMIPLWVHPMRAYLMTWVSKEFLEQSVAA